MIFVAVCTWIVFCIRDYCLLQTGSSIAIRKRVRLYSASLLLTATAIGLALLAAGSGRVRDIVFSPWLLGAAIACHLFVTALCIRLGRRGGFESSWLISLVPAPAPWIFLVMTGTALFPGTDGVSAAALVVAVAGAWVILISMRARLANRAEAVDDLDFCVRFAGWSNSMACCLVPLMVQGS